MALRINAGNATRELTRSVSTASVPQSPLLVVGELRPIIVGTQFQVLIMSEAPRGLNVVAPCPVISQSLRCSKTDGGLINTPAWQWQLRHLATILSFCTVRLLDF